MRLFSFLFRRPLGFALDFSDSSIHLMEASSGSEVTAWARQGIPPGLVENGVILDPAACAEAIQEAVSKALPVPPRTNRVVAELPESQTLSVHFAIDKSVPWRQLEDYVVEKGEESLPVNLEDYAWDYQVLATTPATYEILFAAAPAENVESYEQMLHLAGLKLEVLELESLALTRAVAPIKFDKKSAAAVMDIGGRSSALAFIDDNGLQLSVGVPVAGHALTSFVSKTLQITEAEAEKRKISKGLADKAAGAALRQGLEPLFDEFRQAREYYEGKSGKAVRKLILAGGSSGLPGLVEEAAKELGLDAEKGIPPFRIANVEPSQIVVVSGLALRASRLLLGINFVVPD